MGVVRVDFTGLIAYVVDDKHPGGQAVNEIVVVCANPAYYGLHAHTPRLVADSGVLDWSGMPNGQPLPAATGGGFDLAGWNITLLPDGLPGSGTIRVPAQEIFPDTHDPTLTRLLHPLHRVLDTKAIYEDNRMASRFVNDGAADGVLARVKFSDGRVHCVSDDEGLCEEWAFKLGAAQVHLQAAAPAVCLIQAVRDHLTLHLRSIDDPAVEGKVRIAAGPQVLQRLQILHTCEEAACGDHRAAHLEVYYKMLVNPLRNPTAEIHYTGGGYCPPGGFVPGP